MKRGSERGFALVTATRTTIDFTAVRGERSPASEGRARDRGMRGEKNYSLLDDDVLAPRIHCDVRRRSSRCAERSRPTVRPDLTSPSFAERLAGLSARRARSPASFPPLLRLRSRATSICINLYSRCHSRRWSEGGTFKRDSSMFWC